MSHGKHKLDNDSRGVMSCDGTSGTSSAKTAAKPLGVYFVSQVIDKSRGELLTYSSAN